MKPVVAALAGRSGSGTSVLAVRLASIMNWRFASFGAHIRDVAASRGLQCTRQEQQDIGLELVRDPEAFARVVISKSRWRPGQSLIVDGLRHKEVLDALRYITDQSEVMEIYVDADAPLREARLRDRGEVHSQGVLQIDAHPVEKEMLTILPQLAAMTLDAQLPIAVQIDQLVEFLLHAAEIPPLDAWLTDENLLRVPLSVRNGLEWQVGDRIQFRVYERILLAIKIVDEERMRSAFGRLRSQLAGIDAVEWIRSLRNQSDETAQ